MRLVCQVYHSEFEDGSFTTPNVLHLWALDRENQSHHLILNGVPIVCFVELPSGIRWTDILVEALVAEWKKGKVPIPNSYSVKKGDPLYFYSPKKTTFLECTFTSRIEMMTFAKRLSLPATYLSIRKEKFTFDVHEKNVSPRRRLFTLIGCRYSQWLSVPVTKVEEPTTGEGTEEWVVTDPLKITGIPLDESAGWVTRPALLSFDIETYSHRHMAFPNAEDPKHVAFMISLIYQRVGLKDTRERHVIVMGPTNPIEGVTTHTVDNEVDLVKTFCHLIEELNPEIITGFNIFGFDFPYLDDRHCIQSMEDWPACGKIQGLPAKMVRRTWQSSGAGINKIVYLPMSGRITIDISPIIRQNYKLDKFSLDFVCGHFLGTSKHPMTAPEMFRAYEGIENPTPESIAEFTRVTRYCIQDSELCVDLFDKLNLWIGLVEMSGIVGVDPVDIFNHGQQIRCFSQLSDLSYKNNVVVNSRSIGRVEYEGGFVAQPVPGCYDAVVCLDFASLYPSIIMACNIDYTTLVRPDDMEKMDPDDVTVIKVKVDASGLPLFMPKKELEDASPIDTLDEVDSEPDESKAEEATFMFVKPHIRKGILPALVESLVNERRAVKKVMKALEMEKSKLSGSELEEAELKYNILDSRQNALKISANSAYGFLGVQDHGMLPLIEAAMCITSEGRNLIKQANSWLEKTYGAKVVYNDTDSSMLTIPGVGLKDCNEWGRKIAKEINGTPEKPGIFKEPLKMEFEKSMRLLALKKKMYAALLINDDGNFELEKDGTPKVMVKGIVLARRDKCPFLKKMYMDLLVGILYMKPMRRGVLSLIDGVSTLLQGRVPVRGGLSIIKKLGASYKGNYFMGVFAGELAKMHHPARPGDRLEYIVVNALDGSDKIGMKMRTVEMYEESLATPEGIEGSVYPLEEIDYLYYLTNVLQKPLDLLFSIGFSCSEESVGMYQSENARRKAISASKPMLVMVRVIEDLIKYRNMSMKECGETILTVMPQWFKENM